MSMQNPTYTFSELIELIKISDEQTFIIILEIIEEEADLYPKTELEYIYANMVHAFERLGPFQTIIFKL